AAGCQAVPVPAPNSPGSAVATGDAGLNSVPDCAAGASATLKDGVRIGYLGSDPNDPQRCLLEWSDRSHPLYFGFWNLDPNEPMSDEARTAFRAALTGPVGTEASFAMDRALLWK